MDIKEIKQAAIKLESDIYVLITKFQNDTSTIVDSVDADVGIRGNNTIILTGVYRHRAYVHFYDLGDAEFIKLVEQLKVLRDHALIRHIDAPISFKGGFNL